MHSRFTPRPAPVKPDTLRSEALVTTSRRDLFLLPGGLATGCAPLRLRTLLGSCVSVVVWQPRLLWGGMCHFLLPSRQGAPGESDSGQAPDGRYGDEAMALLKQQMERTGFAPASFVATLCGGANCFDASLQSLAPGHSVWMDIGARNVQAALQWCQRMGLGVARQQVGGTLYRRVSLDVASGVVSVHEGRHEPSLERSS